MKPIIKSISEHPIEELNDMEIATIALVQSTGASLLNGTTGGGQVIILDPRIRETMIAKAKARKGIPASEEQKRRVAEGVRKANIIRLVNHYIYHWSFGNDEKANLHLDVMNKSYGVNLSDPFVIKTLLKIKADRLVAIRCEPYPDDYPCGPKTPFPV